MQAHLFAQPFTAALAEHSLDDNSAVCGRSLALRRGLSMCVVTAVNDCRHPMRHSHMSLSPILPVY
jgi:hypothetical protein